MDFSFQFSLSLKMLEVRCETIIQEVQKVELKNTLCDILKRVRLIEIKRGFGGTAIGVTTVYTDLGSIKNLHEYC